MDSVNLLSVSQVLTQKIREFFEYDDTEPTEEEVEIAELLLEKLSELIHDYVFVEEQKYMDDSSGICSQELFIDEEGEEIVDDEIPLEYKRKAVASYKKHKPWTFKTFQQRFPKVKHRNYIQRWETHISMGGTKFTILKAVEEFVLSQFRESRASFLSVHTGDLRRWALIKAREYPGFKFKACSRWITIFKRRNRISSRRIQKLVKRSAIKDLDQILVQTEKFRAEISPMLTFYEPCNIWNTDQTGFKYEIVSNRTLTWKGERTTIGTAYSPKNKVTHSYTVQYIIAYDGSILPQLYVCLQETGGHFGPLVEQQLFSAPNLIVAASKSGKLSTILVEDFLDKIVVPHAEFNQILYLLDNWTAQTNMQLYEDRFDDQETFDFEVQFVPESCTDLCQPLDTYFHRQLKFIVKQFYYYDALHESGDSSELCTRNGILKLQSLVHFLLSAPEFKAMIRYCWYSSGLWAENEIPTFKNVSEICFKCKEVHCSISECPNMSFIKCSWCYSSFCFKDFYKENHMLACPQSPFN